MMNEKEMQDLIMSSYIITIEQKLVLISAIERKAIPEDELKEILSKLEDAQKKINEKRDEIIKKAKINFNKTLKKVADNTIINLQKVGLAVNETLMNEKEWNPDNILDHI